MRDDRGPLAHTAARRRERLCGHAGANSGNAGPRVRGAGCDAWAGTASAQEPPGGRVVRDVTSLEDLAQAAAAGDAKAADAIVRILADDVYRLSLRMLWHPEDAEDATQEILVKVLTHLSTFRRESTLRTWVGRISANHLLSVRQSRLEKQQWSFDLLANGLSEGIGEPVPSGGPSPGCARDGAPSRRGRASVPGAAAPPRASRAGGSGEGHSARDSLPAHAGVTLRIMPILGFGRLIVDSARDGSTPDRRQIHGFAIVRRNASRASGETRIAFATRTWCNSRRSQRPYTVAADTPSLAATCLTVRSEPIRIGPANGVWTRGGPKSLGSVANAWRESARSSCPSPKDCEGLSVAVTGCDVPCHDPS